MQMQPDYFNRQIMVGVGPSNNQNIMPNNNEEEEQKKEQQQASFDYFNRQTPLYQAYTNYIGGLMNR